MKVLHLLYQSLPNLKGASIRSMNIMKAQAEAGIELAVLSSPFQAPAGTLDERGCEFIDGVAYYRSWNQRPEQAVSATGSGWRGRASKLMQWPSFARRVEEVARAEAADLIHAHGIFYVGLAARRAARKLDIPWVYEVRSVWEDNAVLHGVYGKRSPILAIIRGLENRATKSATAVTTICDGLRVELIARGVDPAKITLAPNAVIPDSGMGLRAEDGTFRIGYVGGIAKTEGLDLILRAAALSRETIPELRVLIVGGGGELEKLRALAKDLNLEDICELPGPVPPEKVGEAYRRIDLFIVPRVRGRVTEIVTPLKPLEAMNNGCLVAVSELGGLLELVEPGRTGLAFEPENAGALSELIERVHSNSDDFEAIRAAGRDWVRRERNWTGVGKKYRQLYAQLLGEA
jgi:glycosyltransferase involved in cell wall biosynthesis